MRVFSASSSGGPRRYASADEMPVQGITTSLLRVHNAVNTPDSVTSVTTIWPFSSSIGAVKSSYTVNGWVTVASVSGMAGLLSGVVTPDVQSGSVDVRITIDGKVVTLSKAVSGHERVLVGAPFSGFMAYAGYVYMSYNAQRAHVLPGIEFSDSLAVEYQVNGVLSADSNDQRSLALYTTY